MKKTIYFLSFCFSLCCLSFNLLAQQDTIIVVEDQEYSVSSDDTELSKADSLVQEAIKEEKKEQFFKVDADFDYVFKWKSKDKFRVFLLDYGISSYYFDGSMNLPDELDDFTLKYPGSVNINLHVFRHRLNIYKNIFNIDYGLSFNFRQYKFQNNFRFMTVDGNLELFKDGVDYEVNKLRTSYLEVPIMLTLTPRKSKFHFAIGGYYALKIGSNQKLKSDTFGKEIIKDDFNLRANSSGGIIRFGFGPIEFYTQFSSESLFKDEEELILEPVTFGIAILGF